MIVETSGEQKEEEGCLSIPDFAEKVVRPARVRVRFADATGTIREIEGTGSWPARSATRSITSNGMLFVDRLRGLKRELTWRKIEKTQARGVW